jgi:cell division initiation protein
MRITPLDIRNHTFTRRLGGYAMDEVHSFIELVADDYEDLIRESAQRWEQITRLDAQVEDLSANSTILQDTLTTAQQLSEDLKRTAMKEAELVVGEAEIKAEKVLDAAHRRSSKLAADLREMRLLRTRMAASLRATIESHLSMLDALSQDGPDEAGLPPGLAPGLDLEAE